VIDCDEFTMFEFKNLIIKDILNAKNRLPLIWQNSKKYCISIYLYIYTYIYTGKLISGTATGY
jgi:hypothetical protein